MKNHKQLLLVNSKEANCIEKKSDRESQGFGVLERFRYWVLFLIGRRGYGHGDERESVVVNKMVLWTKNAD